MKILTGLTTEQVVRATAEGLLERAYASYCSKRTARGPHERQTHRLISYHKHEQLEAYAIIVDDDHWEDFPPADKARFRTLTDGDITAYRVDVPGLLIAAGKNEEARQLANSMRGTNGGS